MPMARPSTQQLPALVPDVGRSKTQLKAQHMCPQLLLCPVSWPDAPYCASAGNYQQLLPVLLPCSWQSELQHCLHAAVSLVLLHAASVQQPVLLVLTVLG